MLYLANYQPRWEKKASGSGFLGFPLCYWLEGGENRHRDMDFLDFRCAIGLKDEKIGIGIWIFLISDVLLA
jgi:hypothetical protein